jgi:putative ABC transport system permease protein
LYEGESLIRNWLKIAFRNLLRHKGYSLINLFGLAVGMTCAILILLYIRDELNYDRYPVKAGSIYRLRLEARTANRGQVRTVRTPPPWAPAMARDYPEVLNYVRFKTPLVSWLVGYEERDKRFHEKGFYFADPSVFEVFSLKLLRGDPATALREPNSLVLTEKAAARYFEGEDPLGKVLRVDNTYDFRVTGVMRDVPRASHIAFDILASFESLNVLPIYGGTQYGTFERNGLNPDVYTYLLLKDGFPPAELEKKMPAFLQTYLGRQLAQANVSLETFLQPLTSIHLRSNYDAELGANASVGDLYILSAVALFILAIACINFMNLATARSAGRAKEVGVRKVAGAERRQLVGQFLGESVLLAGLSLVLAVALAKLLLPVFGNLSGKTLDLDLADPLFLAVAAALAVAVGAASGSYPAFFLSAFRPASVLKGSLRSGGANILLRKGLVVFQFGISLVFIIGTAVVYQQIRFARTKPLGFDKKNVVVLPFGDPRARPLFQSFKDKVLQDPRIKAATGAASLPGGLINTALVIPEGAAPGERVAVDFNLVGYDFLDTLGIELAAGRDFSREHPSDLRQAAILNESAAALFGWKDHPLDKRINLGNANVRVIGVVKDFHVRSLHHRVGPLLLLLSPTPDGLLYAAIRTGAEEPRQTLAFIESQWREVYPHDPFVYTFLEDDYDGLYRAENARGRIFIAFSALTVVIACLGLFGLASFSAEQRKKEIGIRKVLGASAGGLTRMLTLEFVRLVLLASVIASPVAFYAMHRWLRGFAYRVSIGWWIFPAAAVLAVLIALLTVGFQAVRAALANPVEAIHAE